MFTGIIAALGRIETVTPTGRDAQSGVRVQVHAGTLVLADVAIGDSIAVNGACMTVVELRDEVFCVDVSRESLARTVGLDQAGLVNLEKSLRLGDTLDGHLVSGHVDGVGNVVSLEPVGESYELIVRAPRALAPYLAYKGSVAVNGVSLTINRVSDAPDVVEFSINLIPHTLAATNLHLLHGDSRVNLEIDMLARYCARIMATQGVG